MLIILQICQMSKFFQAIFWRTICLSLFSDNEVGIILWALHLPKQQLIFLRYQLTQYLTDSSIYSDSAEILWKQNFTFRPLAGTRKYPLKRNVGRTQSITHVVSSIPICWHSISNCDMHLMQCFSARFKHPFFSLALAIVCVCVCWLLLLWYGFSLVLYAFQ